MYLLVLLHSPYTPYTVSKEALVVAIMAKWPITFWEWLESPCAIAGDATADMGSSQVRSDKTRLGRTWRAFKIAS